VAIEAPNGSSALEDNIDDEVPTVPNGTQRSFSSSLPRSRTPIGGSSASIVSTQPHRDHHHHHHLSQSFTTPQPIPAQTKETFLNYFFGAQGPASAPGSVRSTPPPLPPRGGKSAVVSAVRDVDEFSLDQDLGKSAAMDMKSLEKHIDAVRSLLFSLKKIKV
jgi:dynamin 1-like protein